MRRSQRRTATLAVLGLFVLPALSAAQRGMRGETRAQSPQPIGLGGPPPLPPTVAALVLDHADDFRLSERQRAVLESVRRAQDSANAPWLAKLDSLRPTRQPANGMGDLSQEQRDEMAARRAAVSLVMDGMHEHNVAARQKVMDVLDADQQQRAAELEEDARRKAEDGARRRERDAQGGDRGGRGGRGRPPEG